MRSLILAIATALPNYSGDQAVIGEKIINALELTDKPAQFIRRLYNEKLGIKRRYSVLKDIENSSKGDEFWGDNILSDIPGTQVRNEKYMQEAPVLAKKAVQRVLSRWKRDRKEITHIISVSCTGVMAPGIEFIVQQELGLSPTVQRYGVNFMGCFGAFRALALADSLAKENRDNRILIVCTELCSLHMQIDTRPEILVGNALFGDGAAAVIVGGDPRPLEKPLWAIEGSYSYALEKTQDKMTWSISDHGCVMSLSPEIPKIIEQEAYRFSASLVNSTLFSKYTWAIHPGGKAIIEAIERSCNLTKNQTTASWDVLARYGNMSSATFLFVLHELAQKNEDHKNIIGLGFGPGLSIEGVLLGSNK